MDDIKLSTGREFYANCGIVGIDADLRVFGGYDDGVRGASLDIDWDEGTAWSPEDRIALADFMIARWTAYRAAALPVTTED